MCGRIMTVHSLTLFYNIDQSTVHIGPLVCWTLKCLIKLESIVAFIIQLLMSVQELLKII